VASLVLGLTGPLGLVNPFLLLLSGPAAAITGLAALLSGIGKRVRGKGMAVTGLMLGIFWTIVLMLVIALRVVGQSYWQVDWWPKEPLF